MRNLNLCVKHFVNFNTSQKLVEDREMITSLEKSQLSRWETLIIRASKEKVRNIFDFNVVQLM